MDLEIVKLDEKNTDDFFQLFDARQFEHQDEWKACICRFYYTDCSYEDWMKRTSLINKDEAREEISQKRMTGLLAYENSQCIGWLNVGPILNYKRLLPHLEPNLLNDHTALAICYVIHEDHRKKGVASKLLDEAIKMLTDEGFSLLVALPHDSPVQERNYRGFKQMYLNRNFKEYNHSGQDNYFALDLIHK